MVDPAFANFMAPTGSVVIDAHQHFWPYAVPDYAAWMTGPLVALNGRQMPEDLQPVLEEAGVHYSVAVQTYSSSRETMHFLSLAAEHPFVCGVVGWLDLTDSSVAQNMDSLCESTNGGWLVGVRHTVDISERPSWFGLSAVRSGLRELGDRGLAFDLLVRPNYLDEVVAAVRVAPATTFVLDHAAKPPWGEDLSSWAKSMGELASCRNVFCKISGLITLAPPGTSSREFSGIADVLLETFGPERLIFGSDWPVSVATATYADVLDLARDLMQGLDREQKDAVFGGNAVDAYGLAPRLRGR